MKVQLTALMIALLSVGIVACNDSDESVSTPVVEETTPESIELVKIGGYETGIFGESAAEIPAFDASSKRLFVVNAKKGMVDVLDMSQPAQPVHIGELSARAYLADSEVNSVSVQNGVVALAVQAATKTDHGIVAFFSAKDLSFISQVEVGALPDMLTFSPDGSMVVVANEAEPNADYSVDPEGSVSVIDIRDLKNPQATLVDFKAWNERKAELLAAGVRIYGPNATVAQDLEPEYITIAADSKMAWVTLQENNALAKIDLSTKNVSQIYALGAKDHGITGNELDLSDADGKINIQNWSGVVGMYQPDAIANYQVNGNTYLVTANEGDAREWLKDETAYFSGDSTQGYAEEFRVKHLVHKDGFARRNGDDLPAHLALLATGANLNPEVFAYCGATLGNAGACRDDDQLGRLNVVWNMGYQTHADGSPKLDSKGYLTYDKLYAMGGRSFSIWDTQGSLVWDSGSEFEQKVAELFPDYFNSNHEETAFDDRSDNKGPEPEGVALGTLGKKTFAFIGLERMGGIMVYDITDPKQGKFIQYFNDRKFAEVPEKQGDLGPEGLIFIAAKDSPNGKPLLVVGNEVSGSTAIYQINVKGL